MIDKSDSSLSRMLSVLDLFSDQRLHWNAEDISEQLDVSLPTSYRYLKTLSDAGLLQRGSNAMFTLVLESLCWITILGKLILYCNVVYL